ncbi:MAG: nicotinamide riboside transporter PnuC [Betaproteobacteria bacterium]|nr:nicotinamide riboside transporter PnuC [Betaproteobacteria bacterium]
MLTTLLDWLVTHRIEAAATLLGLVNQWLTIRRNIYCWPVGIASVVLFAAVFLDARLYSDLLLQGVYVALQAYGWHAWLRGGPGSSPLPIRRLPAIDYWRVPLLIVVVAAMLGSLMRLATDASLPYVDASATTLSLVAQWLQARKVLEAWIIFIAGNLLFIGIYAAKGLYITIGLFVVLTVMAALGYRSWQTAYRAGAGH